VTDLALNQSISDLSFFVYAVKTSISVSCFHFTYKSLSLIWQRAHLVIWH